MGFNKGARRSAFLIGLVALLLGGCGGGGADSPPAPVEPASAQPLIVPADELAGWQTVTLDAAAADALGDVVAFVRQNHPGVDALAIAHRGALAVDLTFRESTDRFDDHVGNLDLRLHAELSVTKSMAAMLVGVAMAQGDLPTDLSTPYLPLLPHRGFANPSPRKSAITLEDVLAMRLGLDWNEWDPPYSSSRNQLNRFLAEAHDYTQALFDLPMAADPGAVFAYNTFATTSLGDAIEHAQPLPLEDYAMTYLFMPLDISHVDWIRTPTGLPDLGRGLLLRARDLLKLGQLMLDGGVWRGRRLVAPEWIDTVTAIRTPLEWPDPAAYRWQVRGYGFLWWIGTIAHADTTYDTIVARGFGDQMMMVVPALDLVIAINSGRYGTASRERDLFALCADRILPVFASR